MSLFEFISSMISVIIALAIAQLLISAGRLAQGYGRGRGRVRFYLPHLLWNISIFLIAFLHWWSLWDFRDLAWNSGMFFYSLMGPLLLFFAVTLLSPDPRSDQKFIDLQSHYQDVRVLFLIVYLLTLGFMTFDGPLFGTEPLLNPLRWAQGMMTLCIATAIFSARNAIQLACSAIVVFVLVYASFVRFSPGAVSSVLPLSG